MSATAALAVVMAAWLAIGVVTGRAMGRRGHDGFTWMILGATLGPLVVALALSAWRRAGPSTRPAAGGRRAWPRSPGPVRTGASPRLLCASVLDVDRADATGRPARSPMEKE